MKSLEIILLTIVAIYSTIIAYKWKKVKWGVRTFMILSILLAIVIGWNAIRDYNKHELLEKINSSFGELIDTTNTTKPIIRLANSGAYFNVDNNGVLSLNPSEPFNNLLKAYIKDNKLFINIILRDTTGSVIAVIDGNIWTVFDDNYEYNNDDNAFELVTRGDRKVFFHILLQKGFATVEGCIIKENKLGVYISNIESDSLHHSAFVVQIGKVGSPIIKLTANRIFKYPRQKFYGIREE